MVIKGDKYKELLEYLKSLESVLVAFSGGVDSTFLLKVAKEALGKKVKAVTIDSPYMPKWEIEEATEVTAAIGVSHEIIGAEIIDEIKNNPENRCYLCKKAVFLKIKEVALKQGYKHIVDGTNFDDTKDYRPGLRALKELDIKSPLLYSKFTKEDIRHMSKNMGLKTWDKPAYACLLTRIPYGNQLKLDELEMIEKAEKFFMDKIGIKSIRVRSHNYLARIEVPKSQRFKLFDEKILDEIFSKFKEIGFKYVSMDLEGYRTGSFNETISIKAKEDEK